MLPRLNGPVNLPTERRGHVLEIHNLSDLCRPPPSSSPKCQSQNSLVNLSLSRARSGGWAQAWSRGGLDSQWAGDPRGYAKPCLTFGHDVCERALAVNTWLCNLLTQHGLDVETLAFHKHLDLHTVAASQGVIEFANLGNRYLFTVTSQRLHGCDSRNPPKGLGYASGPQVAGHSCTGPFPGVALTFAHSVSATRQ